MSTTVYTFSGTGNTLAVARDLTERIGAELASIPATIGADVVSLEADAVGLAFPVYHKSIPLILKRFVEKLERLEDAYVFAVCTYGDTTGLALEHLQKLVRSRGGELAAGFGVQMPYNYLTPSPVLRGFFRSFRLREVPGEKQQALLTRALEEVERIAASISAREAGTLQTTADPLTRLADRFGLSETLAKPVWLRVAGVDEPTELSFLESRQLMDEAFWADDGCNGCGICARICPVRNVEMVGGRPVWQHRCEQCFACLQWCPEEAIQFGAGTAGRARYHHPGVTVRDMLGQASQG
jgi:ferredoxin/flavodoxin